MTPNNKMSGSYKAVFIFSLAMMLFTFFSGSYLGPLVWGCQSYLIYKHEYKQLVQLNKSLLVLSCIGAFIVLISSINGDINILNLFSLAVLIPIDFALLQYFKKLIPSDNSSKQKASSFNFSQLPDFLSSLIKKIKSHCLTSLSDTTDKALLVTCFILLTLGMILVFCKA